MGAWTISAGDAITAAYPPGRDGPVQPLLLALVVVVVLGAGVGDARVGQGEGGIQGHRVLEHLQRELEVLAPHPARVVAAA